MRIQTETGQLSTSRPATLPTTPAPTTSGCRAPTTPMRPPQQSYCVRSSGLLGGRPAVLPTQRNRMPVPAGRESGPVLSAWTPARTSRWVLQRMTVSENQPATPALWLCSGDWPVRGSTSASESSSPTCSMSSVATRRHSSSRGRRVISYRTWCFASTTHWRHGCVGQIRRTTKKSARTPGVSLAGCNVPGRTATRILPNRLGAELSHPQRVLCPPRGCPQSQRRWSSNELAREGCGSMAQRQARTMVPRAAATQRRARHPVGGDEPYRQSQSREIHGSHRRTPGRTAALSLRSSERGRR
jgi:hypothetical protein